MRDFVVATFVFAVILSTVDLSSAYQRAFYGGSFTQADGIYSPTFAIWDDNNEEGGRGGWQRVVPPDVGSFPDYAIYDAYPVGEGVFVTGSFLSINGKPSFSVAFFDGKMWIPIAQGLAETEDVNNGDYDMMGEGWSVWCDSATSCYVAGEFTFIENLPSNTSSNNPVNFAHYVRVDDKSTNWTFDPSIIEWNNADLLISSTLPDTALIGSLQGVPAVNPEYFFVAVGDQWSYGTDEGFQTIWRGSKSDGGWRQFLSVNNVFGANLRGYYIDAESESPAVYVVSASSTPSLFAKKTSVVTRACVIPECGLVTGINEWESLPPNDSPQIEALFDVLAVNSTVYYIGLYNPGPGFLSRKVVLKQDGSSTLVPLGAPFSHEAEVDLYRLMLYNDEIAVVGNFETANLEYPNNTDDVTGADRADVRELDSVKYIAVFRNGEWTSYFGGGLGSPLIGTPDELVTWLTIRRNAETNKWIVMSPYLSFVHNIKAEGLAYFDDDSDLKGKNIYALFTRRLARRSGTGEVYDIACEEHNCEYVYAGGSFGYHGRDLLGAIAKVQVRRENPVVLSVGGGLWDTDGAVPSERDLQFSPGTVYALESDDGWIYAGGLFSRGKNGYVCLNNLARIRHRDTETGSWEDLGGGCDDAVYDMHFWGDDLYLAGEFKNCGGSQVNYATAFGTRQSKFHSLNNGLDGAAFSLEYFQGRMIVGGQFEHAGGLSTGGIASWDGQKWRALQSACSDECVPAGLTSYYTLPQQVDGAVDLSASKDGTALYARVFMEGFDTFLGQWKYLEDDGNGQRYGESGQWTIKGDLMEFAPDGLYGDAIMNNGTQLVVAGLTNSFEFGTAGLSVHAYSLENENWVDNNVLIGEQVIVVRSSASTLLSFSFFASVALNNFAIDCASWI
jgi:hypothetical protein